MKPQKTVLNIFRLDFPLTEKHTSYLILTEHVEFSHRLALSCFSSCNRLRTIIRNISPPSSTVGCKGKSASNHVCYCTNIYSVGHCSSFHSLNVPDFTDASSQAIDMMNSPFNWLTTMRIWGRIKYPVVLTPQIKDDLEVLSPLPSVLRL